jgi:hypothetical protein
MTSPKLQSDALEELIMERAGSTGSPVAAAGYAVAYALLQVTQKLEDLSVHVKYLGNGDAATTQGAIEGLTMAVQKAGEDIASAMQPLTIQKWEDV